MGVRTCTRLKYASMSVCPFQDQGTRCGSLAFTTFCRSMGRLCAISTLLSGGVRQFLKPGCTLSITIRAALMEEAPKYDAWRSTERESAFTSSASAGMLSRPRRSSSHSESRDGICSRPARPSSEPHSVGEPASTEALEGCNGGEGRAIMVSFVGRSRRLSSSCRGSGNKD